MNRVFRARGSVLTVMIAALVSAACQGGAGSSPGATPSAAPTNPASDKPAEPVELVIWHNWGADQAGRGPQLQKFFDAFQAAHPNITIKDEEISDADAQMPLRVETAFIAGKEPDIIFHNYLATTAAWPADGVTIPLEDVAKDAGITDRFAPSAIDQLTNADRHLVALPLEGFGWPVWYNTEILTKAGATVPTTVEDLIATAKKVRAAGFQPLATGGNDWTGFSLFTLITQTRITHDEMVELYSKGGFSANSAFAEAVRLFTRLRDNGVFIDNAEGLNFDTQNEAFFSGKAAMLHGGSWSFGDLPKELVDNVELGGFPLPDGSPLAKPAYYYEFTAKAVWVTRNGAKKLDAVKVFLADFFTPEVMATFDFYSPIEGTPTDTSAVTPLYAKSLDLPNKLDIVQIPDLFMPQAIYGDIHTVIQKAFIPGTSAEEILSDLDALYAR